MKNLPTDKTQKLISRLKVVIQLTHLPDREEGHFFPWHCYLVNFFTKWDNTSITSQRWSAYVSQEDQVQTDRS